MQVLFGRGGVFCGKGRSVSARVLIFRSGLAAGSGGLGGSQDLEFFAVEGDDFCGVVGEEHVVGHP